MDSDSALDDLVRYIRTVGPNVDEANVNDFVARIEGVDYQRLSYLAKENRFDLVDRLLPVLQNSQWKSRVDSKDLAITLFGAIDPQGTEVGKRLVDVICGRENLHEPDFFGNTIFEMTPSVVDFRIAVAMRESDDAALARYRAMDGRWSPRGSVLACASVAGDDVIDRAIAHALATDRNVFKRDLVYDASLTSLDVRRESFFWKSFEDGEFTNDQAWKIFCTCAGRGPNPAQVNVVRQLLQQEDIRARVSQDKNFLNNHLTSGNETVEVLLDHPDIMPPTAKTVKWANYINGKNTSQNRRTARGDVLVEMVTTAFKERNDRLKEEREIQRAAEEAEDRKKGVKKRPASPPPRRVTRSRK